jgi:hypothetical protein
MPIRNVSDLDVYDLLPLRDRQKAWGKLMSSEDRKRMRELCAFLGFVEASGLPVDRATVLCLDPPSPDISCKADGSPHLFELGEVTDEGLARRHSPFFKTGRVAGGWFGQDEPLRSILMWKGQKPYRTDGAPVDLLLYYWRQTPYDPVVRRVVWELRAVIYQMLRPGSFPRIWIYEHPARVLCVFQR